MASTITPAQLQPIATDLQNQVNALNALIAGAGGTGGGATPSGASSPGTTITGSGGSITDAHGAIWTMANRVGNYGYQIYKNGTVAYGDGVGTKLVIDVNGVIWAFTSGGIWYMDTGSGWSSQSGGPTT